MNAVYSWYNVEYYSILSTLPGTAPPKSFIGLPTTTSPSRTSAVPHGIPLSIPKTKPILIELKLDSIYAATVTAELQRLPGWQAGNNNIMYPNPTQYICVIVVGLSFEIVATLVHQRSRGSHLWRQSSNPPHRVTIMVERWR